MVYNKQSWVNTPSVLSPLNAARLNHMETQYDEAVATAAAGAAAGDEAVSTAVLAAVASDLEAKAPLASPTFTGTVAGITKAMVGLENVDNTSDADKPLPDSVVAALLAKADANSGLIHGTDGKTYQIVACVLRNSGSGFAVIDDAGHTPIGVASVVQTSTGITINYTFTAVKVITMTASMDETLAQLGYVAGPSVGVDSATIYVSQPGGFSDYVTYSGSAYTSLNGFVTSASMDPGTGLITMNHAAMPIGGSIVGRSVGTRVSMEGQTATTTTCYILPYNSATTVKTPLADQRLWVTRTGARAVPPTELVQSNSNIWVFGLFEVA